MLHVAIEKITEADLQLLVTEGRREDSQLEFKLTLPGSSDDEKREFLKDVSAMANSQGGDIIYGIKEGRSNPEDAGKAVELVGITGEGEDATKLWMFELLNSSIEERLIGVAIRAVQLSAGGFAFSGSRSEKLEFASRCQTPKSLALLCAEFSGCLCYERNRFADRLPLEQYARTATEGV